MYNVCNTNGAATTYGCGRSTNYCSGVGTGWNYGCQRLCQDCCGNIYVNNRMSCCHSCGCRCCSCCGGNTNDGTDANTGNGNGGNGGFTCVTFCGNQSAFTRTTAGSTLTGDTYYAQQYGLSGNGCRRRSGCGCYFNQ